MITSRRSSARAPEYRAAVDTATSPSPATPARSSTSTPRRSSSRRGTDGRVRAREVHTLEPGHRRPPEAHGALGDKVKAGTSPRTAARPPRASWRWARTCSSPSCRSRATTSRTRSSSGAGSSRTRFSPRSTSTSTRSTPARRSQATKRSRATSPTARRSRLRPRRSRCRPHRRRGRLGDLLVGKVTPKGETELTAEEKLIRAIFKEKAREVRDTSSSARRGRQGHRRQDVLPRRRRRPLAGRERARARLRRQEAQDRRGRQAAGRHGNKGVIASDRPRGGHALPRGRHPSTSS